MTISITAHFQPATSPGGQHQVTIGAVSGVVSPVLAAVLIGAALVVNAIEQEIAELDSGESLEPLPLADLRAGVDAAINAGLQGVSDAAAFTVFLSERFVLSGYPVEGQPAPTLQVEGPPTIAELGTILDAAVSFFTSGSFTEFGSQPFAAFVQALEALGHTFQLSTT